jgi:hypothetical protein
MTNDMRSTRRLFLASGAAASVFGALSVASARSTDDMLADLWERLKVEHALRDSFAGPRELEVDFTRRHTNMWALRKEIEAMRPTSVTGIKVKISAAQQALDDDPDLDRDGPGSYASLSQSIMRDVLALAA